MKAAPDSDSKPFGKYDEWMRLLAAFVLTGIIGAVISMYLQERSCVGQRRVADLPMPLGNR